MDEVHGESLWVQESTPQDAFREDGSKDPESDL